jgi:hypothetical protein
MKRLAIWLIPAEPVLSELRAAMRGLAAQWSRSPFEPHATLAVCNLRDDAQALLTALAKRHAPVMLIRVGQLEEPVFARSAALGLVQSPALGGLRGDAVATFAAEAGPFRPHLSLTYGAPPDRAPLEALYARFATPLRFDALRTCVFEHPVETQENVAAWELGGPVTLGA